jgi:hypothetical protein
MKKIKSIKQLKAEKERLIERQAELEKAIKYDWRDVKESLTPTNVAGQAFSKIFEEKDKQNGNTFIADGIAQVAAGFVKKLVEKAEGKFSSWFKK